MNSSHSQEDKEALWLALSDLFLDTETRWSLPGIASVATRLDFTWPEVKFALEQEVSPVVGPNLLSVAGEWACFDEKWLFEKIRASKSSILSLGAGKVWSYICREQVRALEAFCQYLRVFRKTHPEEFQSEVRLLATLLRLHLEKNWFKCFGLWNYLITLAEFPQARLQSAYSEAILPQNKLLLWSKKVETDPTEAEASVNWDNYMRFRQWCEAPKAPISLTILEQLSYFYTVEDLFSTPRGDMVCKELAPLEPSEVECWVTSPEFSEFHGKSGGFANNWSQYQKLRS